MPGPLFLDGEQVTLHPIEEDDLQFLQRLVNDPRVRQGLAAFQPHNLDDEREWLESIGDDEEHLVVCADGDPVGVVGMHRIGGPHGNAELGYYVDPDAQGQGYATDAVRTMTRYGFDERRLHKVTARVFDWNDASQRVLEKAGFEHEGVHREEAFVDGEFVDVHWYGILEDER